MSTIRDVARMCGVSTATVSNVLNARSNRVGEITRTRVLDAVRALSYRPTPLEAGQKAILTRNLALICGDLGRSPLSENRYFGSIFDGVLEGAALRQWSVTIFVERMWPDSGVAVRRSYDGRCDGVILLAPHFDSPLLTTLVQRGVPVVSVGSMVNMTGVSCVDIENESAARELTHYLIGLGHRKIAYLGPDSAVVSTRQRIAGFLSAMDLGNSGREALLLENSKGSVDSEFWRLAKLENPRAEVICAREAVGEFLRPILSLENRPTAIVCWNSEFALQAIDSARRMGLRIPDDLSVVGFDDSPVFSGDGSRVTSMKQPFHRIGLRAAEHLIARVIDPELTATTETFSADFAMMESSGPCHNQFASESRRSCTHQNLPMEVIH